MNRMLLACLALLLSEAAVAAPAAYDPRVSFAPFDYPQPVNRYRGGDGLPGPDYWQNRADYNIKISLDAARKSLRGSEVIHYTNNSPQQLDFLWLQLDQNQSRADARGNFTGAINPPKEQHTEGFRLSRVAIVSAGEEVLARYHVSDTRMRIELPQPVAGKGGTLDLRIDYDYDIPASGGRTDWYSSRNGEVFEIAQFYPRMAVYDDLRGWDTQPYLNSEFYLEYGDFEYAVTVPAEMIVVGSGELVNAPEVLTKAQLERLEQARHSDKTVMLRTVAEVNEDARAPVSNTTHTWRFTMYNTRDVAFGASRAYVWDAARINLPEGGTALAMSAYPVESLEEGAEWARSTEFVKASIEGFSRWYPYPWPVAVAEAGVAGGMEYPGIVFDWWKASKRMGLFALTAHEMGHNWYPMVVGSNERRDAWMDEGFNTFLGVLIAEQYNAGEFGPKRDGEYAPGGGNPVDEILPLLADPSAPAILTIADAIGEKHRHPVSYFKAALGLVLLRDEILGQERFDQALIEYTRAWSFKHPAPSDFFRAIESSAGEDLGWFWRGWFEQNWTFDLAVTRIEQVDEAPAAKDLRAGTPDRRARVTIANLDPLVLPATLEIAFADGSTQRIRVPVETWQQHTSFAVALEQTSPVVSATIDPDQVLPDKDRGNNTFTAPRR